jgi:hypothetical protein
VDRADVIKKVIALRKTDGRLPAEAAIFVAKADELIAKYDLRPEELIERPTRVSWTPRTDGPSYAATRCSRCGSTFGPFIGPMCFMCVFLRDEREPQAGRQERRSSTHGRGSTCNCGNPDCRYQAPGPRRPRGTGPTSRSYQNDPGRYWYEKAYHYAKRTGPSVYQTEKYADDIDAANEAYFGFRYTDGIEAGLRAWRRKNAGW